MNLSNIAYICRLNNVMRHHLNRPCFVLLALVLLLRGASVSADSLYELRVTPAFGLIYPAGRWLPLRIELRNNSDTPVDGVVHIPVSFVAASTDIRIPVVAPPRCRAFITAFGYLPEKPLSETAAPSGTGGVPMAMAEWLASGGARLARAEVLGHPDTAERSSTTGAALLPGQLILAVNGRETIESRDAFRVRPLVEFLASRSSCPLNTGESDVTGLPRHVVGYDAVRAVVFDGVASDLLDGSQREALEGFLVRGGILVLPAPLGAADPTGTWLEQYLPVRIVGRREANTIVSPGQSPLKLRESVDQCEAVEGEGEVLLRDAHYIHASRKRVGLGGVVFTSFPIDALDHSDPRVDALWRELLELDAPRHDWSGSALGQQGDKILESMIGAPAAPWSIAALITCGYVGVMGLIQLMLRGARRPVAFAVGTAIAIGICALLVGLTSFRRTGGNLLSAAQLITIDLGEKGGGVRREAIAFFGKEDATFSLTSDLSASLRPVVTGTDNPAVVEQLPFKAPSAGVRAGRVDRMWEADAAVSLDCAMLGTAQFTAAGVTLEMDNRIGQELLAPVLLWNRQCYRLPSLPVGKTSLLLGPRNPSGDFTNVSVFTGEDASLRGRILESASSAPAESTSAMKSGQSPQIAGWLQPMSYGIASPILNFSSAPHPVRSQIMLRSALKIAPSLVGETIDFAPEFVTMRGDAGRGVFYDDVHREWLQSIQTGNWSIGFGAPSQVGKLVPTHATISADLAAPGHTIVLRRGQCADGSPRDNPDGPIVAEWKQTVGSRTVSIDVAPGDFDANGCVWLRLSVEEAAAGGGSGALPQWKFNNLSVGLTAQVKD